MIERVYFGTYTKHTSKGIYTARFDTEKGILSDLELFAAAENPTYLAFDKQNHLFSVSKQADKGGAASFTQDGHLISRVLEAGAPLCHLSVDEQRRLVYGANYHKGELLIYNIADDGTLSLVNKVVHHGSGIHPNQASAHVHFAGLTPDNCLVTCDLGTDVVTAYAVRPNGQTERIGNYQAAPGAGARHLVFHPHLKTAYLICELNASIEVLTYCGYGQFTHRQTVSTLPKAYRGENACAAIRISSDGKFVYASNRGHDSIAVFKVTDEGNLESLQIIPTSGRQPRDFNLTPDNRHLIVGHQDSDNITIFKRDGQTGRLTELSHDFKVPEVVCVAFKNEKE
ncbi:lactonase family protein [Streptococcus devriesei]|uniref:lactonase family protein n=1 Tax=Streptococcus devriesei TaxID=231233 RepID=UPI0004024346|nr:lactonase family protein [Streptococcus devriesei]